VAQAPPGYHSNNSNSSRHNHHSSNNNFNDNNDDDNDNSGDNAYPWPILSRSKHPMPLTMEQQRTSLLCVGGE
jgi:hypothetical protein